MRRGPRTQRCHINLSSNSRIVSPKGLAGVLSEITNESECIGLIPILLCNKYWMPS